MSASQRSIPDTSEHPDQGDVRTDDSAEQHAVAASRTDGAPRHAVEQAKSEERQGESAQAKRLHDDRSGT